MALLVVGGCASSGSTGGSGHGSTLTIVLPGPPVSLDPCNSRQSSNSPIVKFNILEALTQIDPASGKVDPLLAQSWEQTDPTTWLFHLRTGIKFHDGTDFNAAAAAATITRTKVSKLACVDFVSFSGVDVNASAVDDATLKVTTNIPDPAMPTRLSFIDISSPKTPADQLTQDPIGTGPYKFKDYVQDQKVELVRNDSYWGTKPQVSAATYVFRDTSSVRAAMVKTGEADIAMSVAPQDAAGAKTQTYALNTVMSLRPNISPPLDNVDVRQAIGYAIDRDTIARTLLQGLGKPTNQMVAPIINGYIPNYQGITYNLAKAKELVAKAKAAGAPVDTEIQLIENVNEFPGSNEVIAAVANEINAIGLKVTVKPLEASAWTEQIYRKHQPGDPPYLLMADHGQSSGDAVFSFPNWLGGTGKASTTNDPQVNQLLAQAFSASGDERAKLFQQAAARAYEIGGMIPYEELSGLMVLSKSVDYTANPQTNVCPQLADIKINN